jgi:hypothetical protein
MGDDWEGRVRERAYAIWEREGRPEGGAERHWAQAEEELRAEASAASTAGTETWTGSGGSVGGEPTAEPEAGIGPETRTTGGMLP